MERELRWHGLPDRDVRPRGGGVGFLVHVDDQVGDHVLGAGQPVVHLDVVGDPLPGAGGAGLGLVPVAVLELRGEPVEVAGVEQLGVVVDHVAERLDAVGHGAILAAPGSGLVRSTMLLRARRVPRPSDHRDLRSGAGQRPAVERRPLRLRLRRRRQRQPHLERAALPEQRRARRLRLRPPRGSPAQRPAVAPAPARTWTTSASARCASRSSSRCGRVRLVLEDNAYGSAST